jgi:predicted RNA-binding protein with PIN domain
MDLTVLEDEMLLIHLMQDYCQSRRKTVEIYFDGAPPGQARTQRFGVVTVHFIRKGVKADSAIIQRLHKLRRDARNYTVVTSDRQIQAEARSVQAQVVSSEDFAEEIASLGGKIRKDERIETQKLSAGEVEEWMRIFGEKKAKNS